MCFPQTTNRGISPNIAKGFGNDGLLSDLTRLLNEAEGDFKGDYGFHGQGFPANPHKANQLGVIESSHQNEPQSFHRPISQDPALFSKSIKPSFISHPVPPKIKSSGQIGNTIGGAFYDPKHDLVVSYKVRYYGIQQKSKYQNSRD